MKHFFLFLFLAAPMIMRGQDTDKYELKGQLRVKDGANYAYRLVFGISNSVIQGYSFTKMPDNTETKTAIKGLLNKDQHTLVFTETKLLSVPQKDVTTCMVSTMLKYKAHKNNYLFYGKFAGQDNEKKYCGEGSIELMQPIAETDLFSDDTVKRTTMTDPEPFNETKKEPADAANKITTGMDKVLTWTTDSCMLEIWDGGVIDGDVVSILVNDQPMFMNYSLVKERRMLHLPVSKKKNTTITIVAESEGVNPPNTAQIVLHDGDTSYKITAFNKKGEKATIVIKRK